MNSCIDRSIIHIAHNVEELGGVQYKQQRP